MNIYYFVRGGPNNAVVYPFPAGLRVGCLHINHIVAHVYAHVQMLAGDNSRGVYNASNEADQAISYVCLGQ